ncbi:MAG: PDZ domain-containing protein [Clostridia bacterium]|nr:PDZ domain-containing protein [Clostridia bacterium]
MKNTFLRISTVVFVAIISAFLGLIISYNYLNSKFISTGNNIQNNQEFITKILKVDELMKNRFFGSLTDATVIDGMIDGYIKSTGDLFASYIHKSDYKNYLKYATDGTVNTVGIIASPDKDGNLSVKTVLSGSPAYKAKLQTGDVITEINGSSVNKMSYLAALGKLVLSADATVDITWLRNGMSFSATLEFNSDYSGKSVVYGIFSSENSNFVNADSSEDIKRVLYVSIKYFDATTPDMLLEIVSKESVAGLPIIIDLRNNFGGDIDSLQKSADIFVPAGILFNVVTTAEPANDDNSTPYYSDQNEVSVPIAVLVNENTAKEAEVFALIIKEYEKGSIIGTKTAGIASIQSLIDLGDETALCITTRCYSLPKNGSFSEAGITPTYEVASSSVNFEKLATKDDAQLLAALLNFGLKYEEQPADPNLPEVPTT